MQNNTGMSRRELLQRVGAAGGHGAACVAMQGLGLLPAVAAAQAPALDRAAPHGTRVVILGAGIAGMSAAHELGKAGYDCLLLEARERSGGRNWTVRHGTRIEMTDGTVQTCTFDNDSDGPDGRPIYFNAGAARLPSQHRLMLGYCRELGVPLEVEVNTSRGALALNPAANGGRPIEMRQLLNDTRGKVAELLDKALDRGALDQELNARDKERMLAFLQQYGDLSPDKLYKGSSRAGYAQRPGAAGEHGSLRDPVSLDVLLDTDLWNGAIFEDLIDQQATMFQPVGGMDRIAVAFEKALGRRVCHRCEVSEIRRAGTGVRVAYRDGKTRRMEAVTAAYCISTIPAPVLQGIPSDFSPAVAQALAGIHYHESVKVAWQSRRFWEQDDRIYGGISWIKGMTNMVWYPSDRLFAERGLLLGAYASGKNGTALAAYTLQQQFEMTRGIVEQLHPGHGRELQKPVAVAWKKLRHSLGAAAEYEPGQTAEFDLLNQADGPFYFAGDYLAHIGTWQEAAVASARRTVGMLDQRRRTTAAAASGRAV